MTWPPGRAVRTPDHRAHQVDPGYQGGDPGHPVPRLGHHAVLVVDGRPVHPDQDVTRREVVRGEPAHPLAHGVPVPLDQEGGEGVGHVDGDLRVAGHGATVPIPWGASTAVTERRGPPPPPSGGGRHRCRPPRWPPARIARGGLHTDGTSFYWVEGRPEEGGRQVVVVDRGGEVPEELTPPGVSVRSRVHEYGGGAAATTPDHHDYVDQADQRLMRLDRRHPGPPVPLTPPSRPGRIGPLRRRLPHPVGSVAGSRGGAAGGERHHPPLVAVATDGSLRTRVVVDDGDFVAAPRVSPDGRYGWPGCGWDHPDMPWDRSSVWGGRARRRGRRCGSASRGGWPEGTPVSASPGGPEAGDLLFVDDRTGWWLPYRVEAAGLAATRPHRRRPWSTVEAEFHAPDWVLGPVHPGRGRPTARWWPACTAGDGTTWCGWRRRPPRGTTTRPVGDGPSSTSPACASPAWRWPATAAAWPSWAAPRRRPRWWWSWTWGGGGGAGRMPRRLSTRAGGAAGSATPVAVRPSRSSPTPRPARSPGWSSSRRATGVTGPAGELPPLVVFCHGGPTGAGDPGYDPVVQFFTGRGLAVAAVDYRGSTGYGRAYRQTPAGRVGGGRRGGLHRLRRGPGRGGPGGRPADGHPRHQRRGAHRPRGPGGLGPVRRRRLLVRGHRPRVAGRRHPRLRVPVPRRPGRVRCRPPGAPTGSGPRSTTPTGSPGRCCCCRAPTTPSSPWPRPRRFAAALAPSGCPARLQVFDGESHGFRRADTIEACLTAELDFYRSLFDPTHHPPVDRPPTDAADGPGAR